MPEGPEIRRAADRVGAAVVGHDLRSVELAFPRLRRLEAGLAGQRVVEVGTHGKAMLTSFSGGLTLYSHNQLYGRWLIVRPGTEPATSRSLRVALRTDHRDALLYSASDVDVLDADGLASHPFLRRLGPDALWPSLDWSEVDERLRSRTFAGRQLAAVLLDQGFVAGLGNYLRAEILHAARVHPGRRPADLGRPERQRVARQTLAVTRRSYRTGGVTVTARDRQRLVDAGASSRRSRFAVFARAGSPCVRCGECVVRGTFAGRRMYWCPSCQPEAG